MVGHSFHNYDTIYVGFYEFHIFIILWVFLSRILVKISYIRAFIPRKRPFSTHIRVQNLRIYAAFKGPYIRGLKLIRVYAIT